MGFLSSIYRQQQQQQQSPPLGTRKTRRRFRMIYRRAAVVCPGIIHAERSAAYTNIIFVRCGGGAPPTRRARAPGFTVSRAGTPRAGTRVPRGREWVIEFDSRTNIVVSPPAVPRPRPQRPFCRPARPRFKPREGIPPTTGRCAPSAPPRLVHHRRRAYNNIRYGRSRGGRRFVVVVVVVLFAELRRLRRLWIFIRVCSPNVCQLYYYYYCFFNTFFNETRARPVFFLRPPHRPRPPSRSHPRAVVVTNVPFR